MTVGQMRDAALAYAARGWHVFPVKPLRKEPLSISGVTVNGLNDATIDPDLIARMWRDNANANVGIATGPSGLVVIDIDMNPWKQKVGNETWAEHVMEHGHTDTYTARTWSGGLHYFYADPDGEVRNSQGDLNPEKPTLGRDIDTRGLGGYVVAAPSYVSEDGHTGRYETLKDLPVAARPQWIVDRLRKPEPRQRAGSAPMAAQDRVLRRLHDLAGELRDAPEGTGNGTAARLAYMAGQYVGAGQVDEDEAIGIFLDAIAGWQHQNPRGAEMMETTIINQVRAGARNPRAWEEPISATPRSIPAVPDPFVAQESAPPVHPPEEDEGDDGKSVSMWATDNGQGVFLRDRVGNMLYAVGVGWLVWDGKRWEPVQEEFIANRVSRFYREQFEKMLAKWSAAPGDSKWLEIAKAYRSFMSSGRLKSILNALKVTDGVLVSAAALDTHVDLLNVQNGVVDLRTGVIRPHDRKLLFTKITKAKYVPGATHPDWDKARTALESDVADYMQLRLGQAITGRTPESDDVVFLMGGGDNGKSSWTSEGVYHVLGDYAALAQPTLIGKQSTGSGPSPERVGLRGCRYVLIEELEEGKSLNIAEVKRVIGTPVITARNLNEKEVTFPASHTLFVTTNYTPVVAEVDEGTWRRLCRVEFPFRFTLEPSGPLDRLGDAGLKVRIREGKHGQHEAMLAWLVAGARRYYADPESIMRSRRPNPVAKATADWRKEADRVLAYIEERIEFDPDGMVAKADLLFDFTRFLEDNNHAKWAAETFFSRFGSHQVIRQSGVAQGQSRSAEKCSRPHTPGTTFDSRMPVLKSSPRVFRGIRFRTD